MTREGQGERDLSHRERIRRMFAAIAPRYDLLNHLLSFNADRLWRRITARHVRSHVDSCAAPVLDLCCGTGDLALQVAPYAPVVGMDFCRPMLRLAEQKISRRRVRVTLVEGDALSLPFPDGTFAAVTIAFGLRNLESPAAGLREIYRVLRPGGLAAILEFSRPQIPIFRHLFLFYFSTFLPRVGTWISGVPGPYRYLHDSVRAFLSQRELAHLMEEIGFANVRYINLTGGIAALHLGEKRP